MAQEPGVLPGVDPRGRTVAQRTQHAVALLCGRVGCGRCSDADRVGEQVEVGGLGGGVNALPQQRERLHAVEEVGLDPGAGERGLDLPGQLHAPDRRGVVRCPAGLPPGTHHRVPKLLARGFRSGGLVGDRDPPARGDGGLL